jgi:putative membrane protein
MVTSRNIGFFKFLSWSGPHLVWLTFVSVGVAYLYKNGIIVFSIPWLPISVIGTAVAFYVGFKNNRAFDRMWEARKIWGAIVNSSRTWGMNIDGFITNQFNEVTQNEDVIHAMKKRLIYRHIAWLYTLRSQLLIPTEWEHVTQQGHLGKTAKRYQNRFGVGLVNDEVTKIELKQYLPNDEYARLINHQNTATQIINEQSRELSQLRQEGVIEDFRHMELAKVLADFYTHQGKLERIKKFPLPRQYANISRYFVGIFIALLPFSMMPELLSAGTYGIWLSVPITVLVSWVYLTMELVGDYTENPFEGMANDIPMFSLCRTIEIDLREMLGETDLPDAIKSKNDVLM